MTSVELVVERGKVLKLEHSVQHCYYFMAIVSGNENLTIMEANKSVIKFRSRLEKLNDSYIDLTKKYKEQQRRVINEMVAISSEYTEPMAHLGQVISKLDILVRLCVGLISFRPFSKVRK
jgi:DNA mismatch repair ATPase MutS